MATKNLVKKRNQRKSTEYVSNPFKLVFRGMDLWLNYNQLLSIFVIVVTFSGVLINFFFSLEPATAGQNRSESIKAVMQLAVLVTIVIGSIAFTTIYNGMVAYIGLSTLKKKTVTFAEALQASLDKFWTILLVQIIVFFKVLGGFLLFIVPGVRAALRYSVVNFYIFDKAANANEAIKNTKALTRDHLIEVFGMHTAANIVPIVGGLLTAGGQSVMYDQLMRLKASKQQKPKVHWLNYLGFVLIAGVMLLIMIILFIAIIAFSQLSELPG